MPPPWQGVADGALVFDPEDESFVLLGGRGDAGSGWTPLVVSLRMQELGGSFVEEGAFPNYTTVRVVTVGSPVCQAGGWTCLCLVEDCGDTGSPVPPGTPIASLTFGIDGTVASHRAAICDQADLQLGLDTPDVGCVDLVPGGCAMCAVDPTFLDGCDADPYCAGNNVELVDGDWVAVERYVQPIAGRIDPSTA